MVDKEFPHIATDDPQEDLMGLGEQDIADMQKELFKSPPLGFNPRRNEPIDEMIADAIEEMDIKIPIIWVKGNLYQVGSQKMVFSIERNTLMLRFAEGLRNFHDFILKSEKQIQRVLTIFALKSGDSMEHVMNQLVKDRQIKNINNQFGV